MGGNWEGAEFLADEEYDDDESCFPPGVRFDPTEQELLGFYLPRKAAGLKLPPAVEAAVPFLDLFTPAADPPWLLHPACSPSSASIHGSVAPRDVTEWCYCFTRTIPCASGSSRTTRSGTWLTSGGDRKVESGRGQTLGYKNTLAFKLPGSASKWVGTGWVMHEFKTHHERKAAKKNAGDGGGSSGEQLVLCRFRCTKLVEGHEEHPRAEPQLPEEAARGKRRKTRGVPSASTGCTSSGNHGTELIPATPHVPSPPPMEATADPGVDMVADPQASVAPVPLTPYDYAGEFDYQSVFDLPPLSEGDLWATVSWSSVVVEKDYYGDMHLLVAPEAYPNSSWGTAESDAWRPFKPSFLSHGLESLPGKEPPAGTDEQPAAPTAAGLSCPAFPAGRAGDIEFLFPL